jgi:hypothetical protein
MSSEAAKRPDAGISPKQAQENEWRKKTGLPDSTRVGTRNRPTSTQEAKKAFANVRRNTPEYSVWKKSAGASDALVGRGCRQSAADRRETYRGKDELDRFREHRKEAIPQDI